MAHGGWGTTRIKGVSACHPERRHYAKGMCRQCYRNTPEFLTKRHDYYVNNKDLFRAQTKRARDEHRKLARTFGVPGPDLQAMLEAQQGRCAICGDPPKRRRLALDHDHQTGQVRAFLCHACNNAIGLFRDDVSRLRKAIAYLRAHRRYHSVRAAAPSA